jgi:hypothetical protein
MEEQLPIITHENESKTVKIIYRGSDYVYIYSVLNNVAIHLEDIEFLVDSLNNM